MLRLKVEKIREAQHPSELIVSVTTADGSKEQLVVSSRSLKNDSIEVGYALGRDEDRFLIELPRETLAGLWRLWVRKDALIEEKEPAAA